MQQWLTSIWYAARTPPLWLRALARLFGVLAAARRALYRRGWFASVRLPVPVIVIGNPSVGGTGKTPLTLWLAGQLQLRGLRVGVVLRGYGRSAAQPQRVSADSTPDEVGDEALLIRQRADCLVAVGADRIAAAQLLLAQGVEVILADDGLQHLRLQRDLEIAVVDATRGLGNGWLLPAGPLREPPERLAGVAALVVNGAAWRAPVAVPLQVSMQLSGRWLQPLGGADEAVPLAQFTGRRVHAVAGIGNPARFFTTLRAAGLEPLEHPFGDHHRFREADLRFGEALPVLMTEKDAVKCRGFALPQCWYLPVEAVFSAADAAHLLGRVFLDARLLEILACPLCKGPLQYERSEQLLVCRGDRLAFPIRDGVPMMLEEEARTLAPDDPLLAQR